MPSEDFTIEHHDVFVIKRMGFSTRVRVKPSFKISPIETSRATGMLVSRNSFSLSKKARASNCSLG